MFITFTLIQSQNVISLLQLFMKLRVYRNKKDVFTKSKDTSLTGPLEFSVINIFLCFQDLNYRKIDLISHLKSWQRLGHDFEDRVKFTTKGHRK